MYKYNYTGYKSAIGGSYSISSYDISSHVYDISIVDKKTTGGIMRK